MEEIEKLDDLEIEENILHVENVESEGIALEIIEEGIQKEESKISMSGNPEVAIGHSEGGVIIHVGNSMDNEDDDDNTFPCPECHTLLDASKYGKIKCSNPDCGKILFRRNTKLKVIEFTTIDEQEAKEYKKIIAHINNKIIDGKFDLAYRYCLKAEILAPGEPTTWEYTARCEFYKDIDKTIKLKAKNVMAILRKCKLHGLEDGKIEELSIDIANELFYAVKRAVNNIRPVGKDSDKKDLWSVKEITKLTPYINAYVETCYSLYKDPRYLEEAVVELSKPYKWIVRDSKGELLNLPTCGNYPAVKRRNEFINKIQKLKPDYQPPQIAEERFGPIVWEEEEEITIIKDEDLDIIWSD